MEQLLRSGQFPDCLNHRHNVFQRHIGLNIMHRTEDEAAILAQDVALPQYFFPDLLRFSVWEGSLRVNAPAPENQIFPILPFQINRSIPAADN